MDPRVVAVSGLLKGAVRRFENGAISIGRDVANNLRIHDRAVSRRHCLISQENGQVRLADLESLNGTFVNGIPVKQKTLEHGDMIRVGSCELLFLVHPDDRDHSGTIMLSEKETSDRVKTVRLEAGSLHSLLGLDVRRMARDLSALLKIGKTINSLRELEPLQRQLLELVFEVVPADSAAILLLKGIEDDPDSIFTLDRGPGPAAKLQIRRELVHRALWERSTVFTEADSQAESLPAEQVICVPLIAVEKQLGVMYLVSRQKAKAFQEDHVLFLNSLAGIAAVSLENVLALDALRSENRRLSEELNLETAIVGESRQMRHVLEFVNKVAFTDTTVLIRGESGTGKEMVARAIHRNGPRADCPFVAINCAAIPEALIESELFGHEKGAFTGAVGLKKGKLEVAENGTVFLDEIGELPAAMQAKLLRVLQQREFERVGGNRVLKLQARVLAATNRNLESAIKAGEFRQDLYYRLNVVSVIVPTLRQHREDIPLLALYFASKYGERCKRPIRGVSPEARTLLMEYSWPGNVRELENAIEHAVVLGSSDVIMPEDLPEALLEVKSPEIKRSKYQSSINELKKQLIINALAQAGGSYTEGAKLLGVHPNYLHRLIRNLNLKAELQKV